MSKKMMRKTWEYQIVRETIGYLIPDLEKLGAEGWEVAGVLELTEISGPGSIGNLGVGARVLLKRPTGFSEISE